MFHINGETWQIALVSPGHPGLCRSDGDCSIGCCDDNEKCIYICDTLSMVMIKQVLCHEIVHATMFSYNVDLDYEQEEMLADLLATYGQEIINIANTTFEKIKKRETD